MDFDDKVALVTGGASGMGAATARLLAERGATVVVVDRNEPLAKQVATHFGLDEPIVGDVSESEFCARAVSTAVERHGRLDVLVNAAGIIVRAAGTNTTDDQWRKIFGVNVDGVFYMSRAALEPMVRQRAGAIVNFGSIWGDVGATGVLAYCATKGAVHQITRAMALDHVGHGIRINAVCPGEVDTPMLASERSEPPTREYLDQLARDTIPMKRLAAPEEIAEVVVFLASDAASYMTGSLVTVDAGYTAR